MKETAIGMPHEKNDQKFIYETLKCVMLRKLSKQVKKIMKEKKQEIIN